MKLSESTRLVHLDVPAILRAKCKNNSGDEIDSSLDLNACIGNHDGHFDAPGERFAESATDINLKDLVLHANLKRRVSGKPHHDEVNLDKCVLNDNGHLKFRLGDFISAKRNFTVGSSAVSGLCDTCRGFPTSKDPRSGLGVPDGVFSATLEQLDAQKNRTHCPVCDLFTRMARHLAKEDPRYAQPTTICTGGWLGRNRDGPAWARVEYKEEPGKHDPARSRQFFLYKKPDAHIESQTFEDIRSAQHFVADPLSDGTIARVQGWIEECVKKHSQCMLGNEQTLPTRILDLESKGPGNVQLIATNGQKGDYACLSYSWGNAVGANLTEHNYEEYQTGLRVDSLPKTYRDVIAFCRRLSIRYLWIDALCILQKNKEDWERESVKMDEYYGGSYLCVAATSSHNLDGGCIAHSKPIEFSGRGRDNKPYTVFIRPEIPHIAHGNFDSVKDNSFPLLGRGWCYQERRLSPRVLHFTGYELFFECGETCVCECGEPGDRNASASWTKNKEAFYVEHSDIGAKEDPMQVKYEWFAHVCAYSELALTRETDKLPAISGLAKHCLEKNEKLGNQSGRYLAGLWENQLIDGLTWCVGKDLKSHVKEGNLTRWGVTSNARSAESPRPKNYLAPSWSWASVVDQVQYNIPFSNHLCKVVNAQTTLATDNPLSKVTAGSVTLHGQLSSCRAEYITTGFLPGYWGLPGLPGTKGRKCMGWWPDYKLSNEEVQSMKLFLMPLASRPRGQDHRFIATLLSLGDLTIYLVLRSKDAHSYERIGWTYTKGKAIKMETRKSKDIIIA